MYISVFQCGEPIYRLLSMIGFLSMPKSEGLPNSLIFVLEERQEHSGEGGVST